ncbi:MAG: hypothetical protein HYV63_08710 [Candidatus Schekmanbacteria bacterium]|nr:hypothetical protein [Candidatus Schekmanbacteria bacterium]
MKQGIALIALLALSAPLFEVAIARAEGDGLDALLGALTENLMDEHNARNDKDKEATVNLRDERRQIAVDVLLGNDPLLAEIGQRIAEHEYRKDQVDKGAPCWSPDGRSKSVEYCKQYQEDARRKNRRDAAKLGAGILSTILSSNPE